ncbi:MAG: hypothetical protein ACLGIK_17050, partial [Gemmatimonadota bacterium]
DPPASVLRHAYAIGAPAIRANCNYFFEPLPPGAGDAARDWRWREPGYAVELPAPALDAPVQRRNAATAIAALRALGGRLPKTALAQGVAGMQLEVVRLPGRTPLLFIEVPASAGVTAGAARDTLVAPFDDLDAGEVLRLIEHEGVTRLHLVPTMASMIVVDPAFGTADTSSLVQV